MSKYSNELKLKVIKYYLEEHHSYSECCKKFNIPSNKSILTCVKKYELHSVQGIFKRLKSSYDGNFKQNVIEYMHVNHLSATQTANHFRLGATNVVLKWERIYYEEGPQSLYEERRGRPKKMKLNKDIEEDLIAENQRLRMENEYLKKLNALVQERIKRENKKK